ncbi:putative DNA polymerase [Frankliniella fusca]|uniref:DNA-directed DNA polymerase n=1 Tax=Frankliniella fusca TaxID=407009 RepID=A0AAE1HPR6_9NEOP|nr:putative DNA polymerase [Frankliniella fusca]
MPSVLTEILDEWDAACFHSDELLAEAYTTFLANLVEASVEDRADPRVIPFLLVGYLAYIRFQDGADPQAVLTYRMALAMCGAGSNAPPHPSTPPARSATPPAEPPRPATPPAGPSRVRKPSPQPGPSKTPREEEEEEVDAQPTLEVLQSRERHLKRFRTTFREEVMTVRGLGDTLPSENIMTDMFDVMLHRQRQAVQAKGDDRVILEIQNSANANNPLWFSMRRTDQLNGKVILDRLNRVLNSNEGFMVDGQLCVSYIHLPTPEAAGRRTVPVANETMDQWVERMKARKTIFCPENDDNMCLARSVAVARARGGMSNRAFSRFKEANSIAQKNAAQKMCDDAHIDSTQPCGIDEELVKRNINTELTLQGAKIICMKAGPWKFIDSLMFLPMPLSAMPKSFGLNELKKGYMPFLANCPDFYNYEGRMLDKDLYCVSGMKSKAADDFHKWYDSQVAKNYVFNFRKELIEYCISDVTILRQACHAFRKLFAGVAGFDPMFQCITLSSACMAAYRRNFLRVNTIGGYHGRGKQSHSALRWLDYESHKLGKVIKTIHTDREVSVMGRRVDGYVELSLENGGVEKRIYQFHGCFWHSCPIHFPPTQDDQTNRYEQTQRLTAMFRRNGFIVIEKWECEFKRELNSDPEVKAFFEANPTTRTPPLNLRDGLAGGRTSALRWYHKADVTKGEKIKMADVVSEYPNANLRGAYPFGHPKLFLEGDPTMPPVEEWNGMVKITVLPPQDLFLPVLPFKCNGKLMFPLCRTCAVTENKDMCQHNARERQITDTWCTPEVQLAIEKGYQLLQVHELYQYPGTKVYNAETGEDGLFSAYVRCFMALKIQASGWPSDCETEEQKAKFVEDTLQHDGVTLDPTKMIKNPALRTLAKLMCNSFWGKFGEKTHRPKTELIFTYGNLMSLISDPTKEVTSLLPLSDACLQVTWMPIEDTEESLPSSSLLHAAFTTCFGRMQLYKYLDIVRERALYHDTDSVAYISRPGEPDLPTGSHLGDLTDQVEEDYGPGSFITEFVAGGPKNYSYLVAKGGNIDDVKVCIKVRGITINRSCDELVTFNNLKAMVMGENDNIVVPIPRQIARLPGWKIVTRASSKNWQPVNTKRRRVDVANTVPHGYNAWAEADEEDQDLLEAMDLLADA